MLVLTPNCGPHERGSRTGKSAMLAGHRALLLRPLTRGSPQEDFRGTILASRSAQATVDRDRLERELASAGRDVLPTLLAAHKEDLACCQIPQQCQGENRNPQDAIAVTFDGKPFWLP